MCQRVTGRIPAGSVLTLAVITICTVLTAIAVVPVVPFPIIAVTISARSVSFSRTFASPCPGKSRELTAGPEIASGRECHGGRGRRSGHARDGHPCEESSRECAGGWESGDEESAEGDGHGHGQNRSARTQKEEYGPTVEGLAHGAWGEGMATVMDKPAYLDLQDVITSDPLVMHVVIGIIGISAVLVLHKCEPGDGGVSKRPARRDVSGWRRMLTACSKHYEAQGCRNGRACRSCVV